jgi:CheY-like chemotaxis protein
MPIYNILQNSAFEPERIEAVAKAFEDALRTLQIDDRSGPEALKLAKAVFEAAQRGERDPDRLRETAVALAGRHLPSAPNDAEAPKPASASRPTVLIVEDDEAFAYAAAKYLESRGYNSVIAAGSMAAFRELDRTAVDVVVADVMLGPNEPHGVSLGRMIRNRDKNMPVVLVTAFPDLLEREKPLPGPALQKPVDLDRLALAVESSRRAVR